MEKSCSKCGAKGPFQIIADGLRCQQCGAVEPHVVPTKYVQPDIPAAPLSGKASSKNSLGA